MDVCGESILHIHINLSFTFCQEEVIKKKRMKKERIGLGQYWIFGERDSRIMEKVTVVWWEWKEFKGVV